jgi:hypothetical protein
MFYTYGLAITRRAYPCHYNRGTYALPDRSIPAIVDASRLKYITYENVCLRPKNIAEYRG